MNVKTYVSFLNRPNNHLFKIRAIVYLIMYLYVYIGALTDAPAEVKSMTAVIQGTEEKK